MDDININGNTGNDSKRQSLINQTLRVFHFAFLAFFFTPFIPSAGVSIENLKARKWAAFSISTAVMIFASMFEYLLAFEVKSTWSVYLILHFFLSLLTGLLLVATLPVPSSEEPDQLRPETGKPHNALIWGVTAAIAAAPLSIWLGDYVSRWGNKIVLKPSFAWVFLAIILAFVPVGLLSGWAIKGKGSRYFYIKTLAILCSFTIASIMFDSGYSLAGTIGSGLFKLNSDPWISYYPNAAFVQCLFAGVIFVVSVWLYTYMFAANKLRTLFTRGIVVLFIGIGFFLQLSMLDSTYPVGIKYNRGMKELGRREWKDAARSFEWIIKRRQSSHLNYVSIENLFIIALSTRDPDLWRRTAESAIKYRDISLKRCLFDIDDLKRTSSVKEIKTIDSGTIPVTPQSYLDDSWSAFLTAVMGSTQGLKENELLFKLKAFSVSSSKKLLPSYNDLDDLKTASEFFGQAPVPIAYEQLASTLDQKIPVLFHDPHEPDWGVVVGYDPSTEAILWLKFGGYDRKKEKKLTKDEISRMIKGLESKLPEKNRVYAETISMTFLSPLIRRMKADNDPFIVLKANPSEEEKKRLYPLIQRDLARRAIEDSDTDLFMRILKPLIPEYKWAGAMAVLSDFEDFSSSNRKTFLPLTTDDIDGMDLWTRKFIVDAFCRRDFSLGSKILLKLFKDLNSENLGDRGVMQWQMRIALKENDQKLAVDGARRYTSLENYSSYSVRSSMAYLARFEKPGTDARRELSNLIAHLPFYTSSGSEISHLRWWCPSYCAAKAILAGDSKKSAWWWSRAVDFDPTNEQYISRYAETLSALGREEESRKMILRKAYIEGRIAQ